MIKKKKDRRKKEYLHSYKNFLFTNATKFKQLRYSLRKDVNDV